MSTQDIILGALQPGRFIASDLLGFAAPADAIAPRNVPSAHRQRLTKPQDLVAMLFRQRARARLAALPRVMVHVSVFTPAGRPAVQISL